MNKETNLGLRTEIIIIFICMIIFALVYNILLVESNYLVEDNKDFVVENNVPKSWVYQGPVQEGYDEELFRISGKYEPLNSSK